MGKEAWCQDWASLGLDWIKAAMIWRKGYPLIGMNIAPETGPPEVRRVVDPAIQKRIDVL